MFVAGENEPGDPIENLCDGKSVSSECRAPLEPEFGNCWKRPEYNWMAAVVKDRNHR
jgi:hypothetical protein